MLYFLKSSFYRVNKLKKHLLFLSIKEYIIKIYGLKNHECSDVSSDAIHSLIDEIEIKPIDYVPGGRLDGVPSHLKEVITFLELSDEDKASILLNQQYDKHKISMVRSYYPNTPYNLLFVNGRLYAFGSFVSPIDVIIDLDTYSVFKINSLRFDVLSSSRLLLHRMLKSPPEYSEKNNVEKKLLVCIKDSRPAHVFFDELSGYYSLRIKLGEKIQAGFSSVASYFEPDMIPGSIGVLDLNREVDRLNGDYVLIRNHHRAH